MNQKKTKLAITIMALLVIAILTMAGCSGNSGGQLESLNLDADAIANTLEAVKADVSDIEAANEVIHVETDTILEGAEPISDDLAGMVDTAHMSSHAVLLLLPYVESAITELDAYKTNPEANRGDILVAIGKIETLNKLMAASAGSTKWVSLMEWPVTDETTHAIVHALGEDPAIQGVPEYKEAAEKLHTAMHGIEDATSSLELDIKLLRDMIKTAGELVSPREVENNWVERGFRAPFPVPSCAASPDLSACRR